MSVTIAGQASLRVYWCNDSALVIQLLEAIAKGSDVRVVDYVPKELSKPTDHLQFDADSKLITLAKYYAEEDLLSIPHFFYRKDRGKIIITPNLSKADREILRWRAKRIFLRPDPSFGPLLAKMKRKEYLLGGGQEGK